MILREAIQQARTRFVAAGFDPVDAARDARVLVQHVTGMAPAALLAHDDRELPASVADAIGLAVERRALREPVAYITGQREFYGRPFVVSRDVLIPRPETELIVDAVIEALPDRTADLRFVDVGTGSGCLAVTLACEFAGARVTASDVSPAALDVARRNASLHGVSARVTFALVPLVPGGCADVDVIVSNPPYVATTRRGELMPDVRDFEPPLALFAGEAGLDVIRPLIASAARVLRRGGWLFMEAGADQGSDVLALAAAAGFTEAEMRIDLAGRDRVLAARR